MAITNQGFRACVHWLGRGYEAIFLESLLSQPASKSAFGCAIYLRDTSDVFKWKLKIKYITRTRTTPVEQKGFIQHTLCMVENTLRPPKVGSSPPYAHMIEFTLVANVVDPSCIRCILNEVLELGKFTAVLPWCFAR